MIGKTEVIHNRSLGSNAVCSESLDNLTYLQSGIVDHDAEARQSTSQENEGGVSNDHNVLRSIKNAIACL